MMKFLNFIICIKYFSISKGLGVVTYPSPFQLDRNPTPESYWAYTQSIHMIKELVDDRMFPLTLSGLDTAMRSLAS